MIVKALQKTWVRNVSELVEVVEKELEDGWVLTRVEHGKVCGGFFLTFKEVE